MGGELFARALIKKLLCLSDDVNNCAGCQSCQCIQDHSHPDFITISADRTAQLSTIKIDTLRDALQRIRSSPTISKYQVLYIPDCHYMTEQCTQALLKTLEEPKLNLRLILQTPYPKQLPKTILSRVFIEPVSVDQKAVTDYIDRMVADSPYQFLAYTHTNVPCAIQELTENKTTLELYCIVIRLLHSLSWQPLEVSQLLDDYPLTTICHCFIHCLYAAIGYAQQGSTHAQQLYHALSQLDKHLASMPLTLAQLDALLYCVLQANMRNSRAVILNAGYQRRHLLISIWQIFHAES
jgi:hypothetical protein